MHIVWFRRDLRTIDNTALQHALASGKPILALFIATPQQWKAHHKAPIQADFLYRRLHELQHELRALNIPLLYAEVADFQEQAAVVMALLTFDNVCAIHANKEYELNEQQRDDLVVSTCPAEKHVYLHHDKCILPPGSVLNQQGSYFKVFTPFKRAWLKKMSDTGVSVAPRPQPTNTQMPAVAVFEPIVHEFHAQSAFSYPRQDSKHYDVRTDSLIQTLRNFCQQEAINYQARRDFPAIAGTSKLSPYLALGCLSARQCVARLTYQKDVDALQAGEQVWLSELIWREFYQHLLEFEPKLSKGLPFVDWAIHLVWRNHADWLACWKAGTTGYPIVDAAMRQLNQTGWMHNRLRMIVASFLTKDLLIDWRQGEDYFMSKLIDGDYAANNGGWQWSASTGCDGQPYFRIFNPISQGEKFDAKGDFVRTWLPELQTVPDKYIHQPWNWKDSHTLDYPPPIVDHKTQRVIALEMYKQAKGFAAVD